MLVKMLLVFCATLLINRFDSAFSSAEGYYNASHNSIKLNLRSEEFTQFRPIHYRKQCLQFANMKATLHEPLWWYIIYSLCFLSHKRVKASVIFQDVMEELFFTM